MPLKLSELLGTGASKPSVFKFLSSILMNFPGASSRRGAVNLVNTAARGLVPVIFLGACASTPEGQSVDRAQYADLGSTAVALSQGAVEANPLMPYLLPVKLIAGQLVDDEPCDTRIAVSKSVNSLTWGAVANNLAVAVGSTAAPAIGAIGGLAYLFALDKGCEPTERQSAKLATWLSINPDVSVISSRWSDNEVVGEALVGADPHRYRFVFEGDQLTAVGFDKLPQVADSSAEAERQDGTFVR